jgi:membrane-associated phospholipid phosphatase
VSDRWRPLPHETAFGVLYLVVVGRLLLAGAAITAVIPWLCLAGLSLAAVGLTARRSTVWTWRVRLGVYIVVMNLAYMAMGPTVAALGEPLRDPLLQRIDTRLFGAPLPLLLDGYARPWLTELLSACYFLLFPYILISSVRHLWRLRDHRAVSLRFYAGFYFVYALAFVGYFFVPAQGPYLALATRFHQPLTGWWITRLNTAVVRDGSNHVDVYPSLHVAASATMLFFDWRYAPWRFRLYLVPAIGLWVATIYLRYHYGVDVISGFCLAVAGLIVAFTLREAGDAALIH